MFAGVDTFKDADSLLELGIIDSTGVLELLAHLEEAFSIHVKDEEIIPENLDSLNNLSAFIMSKVRDAGSPGPCHTTARLPSDDVPS